MEAFFFASFFLAGAFFTAVFFVAVFFADAFFVVEDLAELVFFFFTFDAESDLVDFFLEVVALRAIFCYPED